MSRQGGQVELGANSQRDGCPLIPLVAGKIPASELLWHPDQIVTQVGLGINTAVGQANHHIDGNETDAFYHTTSLDGLGVAYDGADIKVFLFMQLQNAPSAADTVVFRVRAEILKHDGDSWNDEVTDFDQDVTLVVGSNDLNLSEDKLYRVELFTITGKAGGKSFSWKLQHKNSSTHVGDVYQWNFDLVRV